MPDTGTKTTYQDMTVHVNDLIVDGTALSTTELQYLDGVTAGTVTASKAVVVDASKDIASFRDVTVRGLDAGASGSAGTVDSFPATAAKGKLALVGVANDGDTVTTISNAAMGQASVVSVPDPGAATANFTLTSAANDGVVVASTSAEIDQVADTSARLVALAADDTTLVILASDSGRIHTIPDLDATSDIALPAAATGLNYRFYYVGVAADAHNFTLDATGFFIGSITWHDTGATTFNIVDSDSSDDDILTVTKPDTGTWLEVFCDGTNWIITGFVSSTDTPSFA